MEAYFALNTHSSLGVIPRRMEGLGLEAYELNGTYDAITLGRADNLNGIVRLGKTLRLIRGVSKVETYIIIERRGNVKGKKPIGFTFVYAQPERVLRPYVEPESILVKLTQDSNVNASAVLGGLDIIAELYHRTLKDWQKSRDAILKKLPSYVRIETHGVSNFGDSEDNGQIK